MIQGGPHDVAVVDVGSNSVRLVMYRLEGRAIWTVYNEKVLAGLGRDVAAGGRLSPDGVQAALVALRRFKAVLDGARPDQVFAAATAAVREASDGPEFIGRVAREIGMNVSILSGGQEAHASALGVVAGQPDADGVAGDLGGSSLELVRVRDGQPGSGITLPLGPFALGAHAGFDLVRVRALVARRLAHEAIAGYDAPTFYAVGGAWRNLALLHMRMSAYPLAIVHQYAMSSREALEVARLVARQSKGSLDRIPGVSKKRAETLPYAGVVLEQLIERLGIQQVVLSAYGLREGLLFQAMPPEVQARDPLIEGCTALGLRQGVSDRLGPALERWLRPLWRALPATFPEAREPVLLAAACRMADIGARLHPDHRADLAFDQVLRAPIAGQTHAERAFLAAAVFARYTTQAGKVETEVSRMLSPERLRRARALGAGMRLGSHLSGRSPVLLAASGISLEPGLVVLTVQPESADLLLGEQTAKRLDALATALDLRSVMRRG